MNEQQERDYIESNACSCPYCKSDNIEGGELIASNVDGEVYQDIKCLNCKKTWTDVLSVTRVVRDY